MDPLQAGRLVLPGMLNNDLYILTHPEYEPILRAGDALLASIPTQLPSSEERLATARTDSQSSIYLTERDRKRCVRESQRRR